MNIAQATAPSLDFRAPKVASTKVFFFQTEIQSDKTVVIPERIASLRAISNLISQIRRRGLTDYHFRLILITEQFQRRKIR